MHGLVLVNSSQKVLTPSIIWCDSRAVQIGDEAFNKLGNEFCLENFLNSPGNFTASKLKWIKENNSEIFKQVWKIMLPGEYIAMKMTGEILTTVSGLSEGIFWNFKENRVSQELLDYYEINNNLLPDIVDTFSLQGKLTKQASDELGLSEGIYISYRAGDQPNNALSLNVLNSGEIAATAGTSGVVYGITEDNLYDKASRVNAFAHVNYTNKKPNKGLLLCINGTGILNSWLRNELFDGKLTYKEMNEMAKNIPIGANGVLSLPYGNGAERSLGNMEFSAGFFGLNLTRHSKPEIIRAAQEGIAFAFRYGLDIMKEMGIDINLLRAGYSNMFLSPVFREAIANINNVNIELYNTDGAQGAARGAGIGVGTYKTTSEAFEGLEVVQTIKPESQKVDEYLDIYTLWKNQLENYLSS